MMNHREHREQYKVDNAMHTHYTQFFENYTSAKKPNAITTVVPQALSPSPWDSRVF